MFSGVFVLFHARDFHHPGETARIISPKLPSTTKERCMGFDYITRGKHMGILNVKDKDNNILATRGGTNGAGKDSNLFLPLPLL